MPACIVGAVVTALIFAILFGVYGKPYDTGGVHVEGGISEGQSGQVFGGLILGAPVGAGIGYLAVTYLIAPVWWRVRYANKKKK